MARRTLLRQKYDLLTVKMVRKKATCLHFCRLMWGNVFLTHVFVDPPPPPENPEGLFYPYLNK